MRPLQSIRLAGNHEMALSYIDIFDRNIIDYYIGLSCSGQDAFDTLKHALWKRNLFDKEIKPVIRSDNGPQFISHLFQNGCAFYNLDHGQIPVRTPDMNAHIESFHSIFEKEYMPRHEFKNYAGLAKRTVDMER